MSSKERFEGRVVRKRVSAGSKSDREAVVLETKDVDLVLRRQGGNAFSDPALEELVGEYIRGSGRVVARYTLILDGWETLPAPPAKPRRRP